MNRLWTNPPLSEQTRNISVAPSSDPCQPPPMPTCGIYSRPPMNRTVNGSGAGEWLLRVATKPRGVRKGEPRSPAGHTAESSSQLRPVSRGEGPKRGVGSRGHQHRQDADRPEFAERRSGVVLCPVLGISPRVRRLGKARYVGSRATHKGDLEAVYSHDLVFISVIGPISSDDERPSKKLRASGEGV